MDKQEKQKSVYLCRSNLTHQDRFDQIREILKNLGFKVNYWKKGTQYSTDKINASDFMLVIPPEKTLQNRTGYNYRYNFGKGQYDEIRHMYYESKPVLVIRTIDSEENIFVQHGARYLFNGQLIEGNKSWIRDYGQVTFFGRVEGEKLESDSYYLSYADRPELVKNEIKESLDKRILLLIK